MQQNFNPDAPNKVWVSDITYARVKEDIYAICVVIDLYARKALSHAISPNSDTALVKKIFQKAYEQRCPSEGLIFHGDQGSVYTAYSFRKKLRDLKVVQSFSNPGTPYDNAVAESFFSMMKREELSHKWHDSLDELEKTVADYISYFNSYWLLQKLGNLTPDQYESLYWAKHK
ncbi:IS3 family transposase [Candidatus Saccharibacteria bacterium]|nr:IS3 family transposase [Candidatus Saccharibacteria bacterium]